MNTNFKKLNRMWIPFLALGTSLVLSGTARADYVPQVYNFLTTEITRMGTAMVNDQTGDPLAFDENTRQGPFQLNAFSLRIQALVGFDIPVALNVTLVPEIELLWER